MGAQLTRTERVAVERVERAIAALPKTVALYFHGSSATVMACDHDGVIIGVRETGAPDHDAVIEEIDTKRCAAGDF